MPLPRPNSNENLLQGVILLADALERQMIQLAAPRSGRKIAFGATTLTWPGGSVFGDFITITHGLGVTPVVVLATPAGASGLTQDPLVCVFSAGATTFQLRGETIDGQNPLNTAVSSAYWLAIG